MSETRTESAKLPKITNVFEKQKVMKDSLSKASTSFIKTPSGKSSRNDGSMSRTLSSYRISKASREISFTKPDSIEPEKEKIIIKKFPLVVEMIRFCYRWFKWANMKYAKTLDRFISFAHIVDLTQSKVAESSLSKEANTKVEMMNFRKSFHNLLESLSPLYDLNIRRILMTRPEMRGDQDIVTLKSTFKDLTYMKSINHLNDHIQTKLFKICDFVEYEEMRVIVGQNHQPDYFYFVLSGSLVCTYRPLDKKKSNTVCFIEKGMTFAEIPLMADTFHTTNLISRTKVQLLMIAKSDFVDLFVNQIDDQVREMSAKVKPNETESTQIIKETQSNQNIQQEIKIGGILGNYLSSIKTPVENDEHEVNKNIKTFILPK